ncbi:MAG: tyrosine-type recombinase/integrase [Bacteroides thetaiotaomicron]|uniref:Tyrosine-type recombinase/integrase n=1 Tax=Bacteroides thetaiotaomicron TaxID=818 RepID=A0A943HS83_BACT4|nr:tyrosine-type recombinase/integrase [Bacteroides thetaiotaomicron]
MVTEQPQYSVVVCIFHILQNTEIQLISNDLRLIFTCSLSLAQPITFHCLRHTFATTVTLANGVPIESVSKMLGHTDIRTTQIYAKVIDTKLSNDMELLAQKLNSKCLVTV